MVAEVVESQAVEGHEGNRLAPIAGGEGEVRRAEVVVGLRGKEEGQRLEPVANGVYVVRQQNVNICVPTPALTVQSLAPGQTRTVSWARSARTARLDSTRSR